MKLINITTLKPGYLAPPESTTVRDLFLHNQSKCPVKLHISWVLVKCNKLSYPIYEISKRAERL